MFKGIMHSLASTPETSRIGRPSTNTGISVEDFFRARMMILTPRLKRWTEGKEERHWSRTRFPGPDEVLREIEHWPPNANVPLIR
jgi:hypothetical protein